MKIAPARDCGIDDASLAARNRLLATRSEPLFYATWERVVFIHYEADPRVLQKLVPFELDLYEGRAFVSIVAFTMRGMRPRIGGRLTEWLFKPIATHHFLNIRTYVRHAGERGIYFMAEWLSNRLSVALGPATFGLPYRYARIHYEHDSAVPPLRGRVTAAAGTLDYFAPAPAHIPGPCLSGSLAAFLLERYSAFTARGRRKRYFRIWHEPWQQAPLKIRMNENELGGHTGNWWSTAAEPNSAHYSPGVNVWMGWPHAAL